MVWSIKPELVNYGHEIQRKKKTTPINKTLNVYLSFQNEVCQKKQTTLWKQQFARWQSSHLFTGIAIHSLVPEFHAWTIFVKLKHFICPPLFFVFFFSKKNKKLRSAFVMFALMCGSTQAHVQWHHYYEAQDGSPRSQFSIATDKRERLQ